MVYRTSAGIMTHGNLHNVINSAAMSAEPHQKQQALNDVKGNENYYMYAALASDPNLHNNAGGYIDGIPFSTNSAQSMAATFAGVGFVMKDDEYVAAKRSFPNAHITSHIVPAIGNTLSPNFSNAEAFLPKYNVVKNGQNVQYYN